MQIRKNIFKQTLSKDIVQFGIWNGIPDGYVAEILGGAGFDFVLIDSEHGPFDLQSVIHQLQALGQFPVTPIVRPPNGDPVIIKQLLDGGVQTLLVPMIESGEQAELMSRAMRYPPKGIRGVGTALARASQWNRVNNYFRDADDEMCLILQVESVAGYEVLDEILEVDGVDSVFIGPADLAGSMGYLGEPMHPKVIEAVKAGMTKIRKAGKSAGTLAVKKELADEYIKAGANYVGIGVDLVILAKATRKLAEEFNPDLGAQQSNTVY